MGAARPRRPRSHAARAHYRAPRPPTSLISSRTRAQARRRTPPKRRPGERMEVTLAQPRGFCAGEVRAIEIGERALALYGPPVYVLHQRGHDHRALEQCRIRRPMFLEKLA